MNPHVRDAFEAHRALFEQVAGAFAPRIDAAASVIIDSLRAGGTILFCGNGGSAADAQHLCAELVGRFRRERKALRSVALSTDTSILTCVANDYSFEDIFRRQVEGLGRPGDVLVAISTSGNSGNVFRAVEQARSQDLRVIGMLGRDGGRIAPLCDVPLIVPHTDTARIQEMHILIGHILCDLAEVAFCA